ncbi:MAG: hypothetical protein JWN28_857 [Candidatus Saccharibacteria bacterium]|nr:hypothetical protein [Candidatus Saccharibacteria bacterium]
MVLNVESQPTTTPIDAEPVQPGGLSDQARALARRVFTAYERTMSDNERLSALYQIDREQFDEEVEKAVTEYLSGDPDYQELFAKRRAAENRKRGGGDSYGPEMKARHARATELIVNTLNLPDYFRIEGVEDARNNIQNLLKDVPKNRENADLALYTLGLKVKVGEDSGVNEYFYPYDLFPEKVNKRWTNYLVTVKDHVQAERDFEKDRTSENARLKLKNADSTRRYTHDNITNVMNSMLRLDEFGITTEEIREVFSKIRDDELTLNRPQHVKAPTLTPEELTAARMLAKNHFGH